LIPIKTIPNHSWDVSRAFEYGLTDPCGNYTMALKTKTSLLHDIESTNSHQNHPKSFMGCIKNICDD
jgi:hypothetical protein